MRKASNGLSFRRRAPGCRRAALQYAALLLMLCLVAGCGNRWRLPANAGHPAPPWTAPRAGAPPPGASLPVDQPDPASSPGGNGPVVFVWASAALQLSAPQQLAVDAHGTLYVVDSGHGHIVTFAPNGQALTAWGRPGSRSGQFRFVRAPSVVSGLAVDGSGTVYVIDDSAWLESFDRSGHLLGRWPDGGYGMDPGRFDGPSGLAISRQGSVYVTDCGQDAPEDSRVQQFTAGGTFLTAWGGRGSGPGEFACPVMPALDSRGDLYVVDRDNDRVEKFDAQGRFITAWGRYGSGPGEFDSPSAVGVDARGDVYVTDTDNHRVEKFDEQGRFLSEWGSFGTGDGRFRYPVGIAVDEHGDIYVGDSENGRIEKFRPR